MLNNISEQEMCTFLRELYPTIDKSVLTTVARKKINVLDAALEPIIIKYIQDKTLTEFEQGEFTLSYIMALRKCSYPRAILLMDEYIKDPQKGKYEILQR